VIITIWYPNIIIITSNQKPFLSLFVLSLWHLRSYNLQNGKSETVFLWTTTIVETRFVSSIHSVSVRILSFCHHTHSRWTQGWRSRVTTHTYRYITMALNNASDRFKILWRGYVIAAADYSPIRDTLGSNAPLSRIVAIYEKLYAVVCTRVYTPFRGDFETRVNVR